MGLFDRIAFITRSKANALLDDLEDPVQAINQTIEDATKEYAQVIAGETRAKNTLKEYEDKLAAYNKAAENAVLAGDDASATIALDKATEYETLVNTWKVKVANATKDADAMRNKLNAMARDINEMKAKASEIKADLANAEASKAVSKVHSVDSTSWLRKPSVSVLKPKLWLVWISRFRMLVTMCSTGTLTAEQPLRS